METNLQMKRAIMRRVYYVFMLSLILNPAFIHGAALTISFALLAQAVHVRAIMSNFFATPVGQVPQYIVQSFSGAEVAVLILIGTITFLLLSFGLTFKHRRVSHTHTQLA